MRRGLKRRFAELVTEEEGSLELAAVANVLLEGKHWDDRMQAALLNASVDDFVELFRDNQGEMLRKLIDSLYRAAHFRGAETAPIAAVVTDALNKIATESKLNEMRAKRWRR
jgi:hypothetical protein